MRRERSGHCATQRMLPISHVWRWRRGRRRGSGQGRQDPRQQGDSRGKMSGLRRQGLANTLRGGKGSETRSNHGTQQTNSIVNQRRRRELVLSTDQHGGGESAFYNVLKVVTHSRERSPLVLLLRMRGRGGSTGEMRGSSLEAALHPHRRIQWLHWPERASFTTEFRPTTADFLHLDLSGLQPASSSTLEVVSLSRSCLWDASRLKTKPLATSQS